MTTHMPSVSTDHASTNLQDALHRIKELADQNLAFAEALRHSHSGGRCPRQRAWDHY
jgi:hypothetical protein